MLTTAKAPAGFQTLAGGMRPDKAVKRIAGLVAAAIALTFVFDAAPAVAAKAPHNWMREFVQLRQLALAERVIGPEAAAELRSRMSTRIVGGRIAAPDSHPFQVGLLFKHDPDNFFAQYCGGSLIRPDVVVTAAHCSDFVNPRDVQVLTGTQRLDGSGTRRNVVRIRIHPDWNPANTNSDIAIWWLATPARDIPLARIGWEDPSTVPGVMMLATGWGSVVAQNPGFDKPDRYAVNLREVRLPLVSMQNCNDRNSYDGAITRNMLCAGFDQGGKDTCSGDSGGPLTLPVNGRFQVLMGITSWGFGCAYPDLFGVYTRVSRFRSWILNQID
jgi:secreted trypsin-like serine protease